MNTLCTFQIVIIIVLVATTPLVLSLDFVDAGGYSNIEGRSFSLVSTVKSAYSYGPSLYIESSERYSIEQRRGKIEFRITKTTNNITRQSFPSWMIDSEQNLVLEYNRRKPKCLPSSVDRIKNSFNYYLPESSETKEIDMHVVGPARVMLFVEKYRAKMAYLFANVVRNLNCLVYKLDHNNPDGEGIVRFLIYYSKLSLTADPHAHPVRIKMSQEGKPFLEFDFLQVLPAAQISNQASNSAQVKLDPLRFPPLIGCSEIMAETNSIDLFQNQTAQRVSRFSFEAIHEPTSSKVGSSGNSARLAAKTKSFVAYDSALNSMLVETLAQPDSRVIEDTPLSSRKILNFELNRMYRIAIPESGEPGAYHGSFGQRESSRSRKCTVSMLMTPGLVKSKLTIGRLLVGTDRFVCMGKAQVRGIDAKVYEAHNVTELPYWLAQPIVYKENRTRRLMMQTTDTNGAHLKPNDSIHDPSNVIRYVMLYFGEKEANHPLLLIEIYTVDPINQDILAKKSIQVHNFAWNLVESATGGRVSDLFSLRDSCTDYKGAAAKVELILKSDEIHDQADSEGFDILLPDLRNLALLASLQKELLLPSQMVFEMETTLIDSTLSAKQQRNFLKMVATFNVAIHTSTMVRPVYLGQGLQSDSKTSKSSRSFQDCFHLAAHQYEPVYFGYSVRTKTCYLDPEPLVLTQDPEAPDSFKIFENGTVEVYRTDYYDNIGQMHFSSWAREIPEEEIEYNSKSIRFLNTVSQSEDLIFTIKSAKKEYDDPIAPPHKTSKAAVNLTSASFVGLALPRAKGNRLVQPSSLADLSWITTGQQQQQIIDSDSSKSSMTLEQCHSACLGDFECQSFSVCTRGAQVECVISKTAFKSANVIEQLAPATKTARKGTLTVRLDDQTSVELTKRPNCELRNKNFFELFRKQRQTVLNLRNRFLKAVDGRAGCAEMCFMENLKLMKQDTTKNRALFESLSPEDKAVHSEKVQSIITEHRESMKKLCTHIYYLDKRQIRMRKEADEIESKIRNLVLMGKKLADPKTAGGFCIVPAPSNYSLVYYRDDFFTLNFDVEVYEFKMESFYEKQYGVGMKGSALTEKQFEAYDEIIWKGLLASQEALSTVRKLVERGENFAALITSIQPTECARICFTQASDRLWPACRSFDIVQVGSSLRCQLNTITLAQARASGGRQLISMPEDTRIWHYEPRSGFVLDESVLDGNVELAEESLFSKRQFSSTFGVRFHFFSSFLIVLLGLASGIVFGLWLGKRIHATNNISTTPRVEVEGLVEDTREIEFANQLNSNGQVVGINWFGQLEINSISMAEVKSFSNRK